MSKVKKLYKYKLKLNDSYMSELALSQELNLPIIELPPDMTNPIQNLTPDVTNPPTLQLEVSSVSEKVDKEIGLEMSTKLQNLIQHVGDEMYVTLEKCRNDGDYMQIKTTSSALDCVYDMLKFVNYQDISQVDYALLEILKIANEFTIKVPENLQYESIYNVDITLNDGLEYNEEEKKAEYFEGLKLTTEENSKAAIVGKKITRSQRKVLGRCEYSTSSYQQVKK